MRFADAWLDIGCRLVEGVRGELSEVLHMARDGCFVDQSERERERSRGTRAIYECVSVALIRLSGRRNMFGPFGFCDLCF